MTDIPTVHPNVQKLSAAIRPYVDSPGASLRIAESLVSGEYDEPAKPAPTEYAAKSTELVQRWITADSKTDTKMMAAGVLALLDLADAIRNC